MLYYANILRSLVLFAIFSSNFWQWIVMYFRFAPAQKWVSRNGARSGLNDCTRDSISLWNENSSQRGIDVGILMD